jgi:hypothetical protein
MLSRDLEGVDCSFSAVRRFNRVSSVGISQDFAFQHSFLES